MFLPEDDGATRKAEDARNAGYAQVEAWSLDLIPADIRTGAIVSVQEVQCGDPTCAPIDTAVTIVFESGGGGMFGIPAEAKDVEQKHIKRRNQVVPVVLDEPPRAQRHAEGAGTGAHGTEGARPSQREHSHQSTHHHQGH